MEKASAKKTGKSTAKKRERKTPKLFHMDAETIAILAEDADGYGLSEAAYVRMLIRKERHNAQQGAASRG